MPDQQSKAKKCYWDQWRVSQVLRTIARTRWTQQWRRGRCDTEATWGTGGAGEEIDGQADGYDEKRRGKGKGEEKKKLKLKELKMMLLAKLEDEVRGLAEIVGEEAVDTTRKKARDAEVKN